ncbi:tyrosine-type recombinase/integrase [Hydrogenovibrio marinus]|uniref:tyrosine-type recombinase/integrase n=1 Tax=Hydrogenovibrio marinus TaxID=28885 RepID=UPI00068D7C63|nr:site-specific integrase [Hydrogenovibrio marinus]
MQSAWSGNRRLRDTALLLVAITGGLRASELIGLKVADIDVKARVVHVEQGKGRKNREVYLPRETSQSIQRWLNVLKDDGSVFRKVTKAGKVQSSLTSAGITAIFKAMAEEAGISAFSPHDLRRTYITDLLNNGVDINVVRQMAGHEDVSTTVRYDFRGNQSKRDAVGKLSTYCH